MKQNKLRRNKSKKEIVSDIQLVQSTERRRSLVRDIIFPYLVSMKDTVGYSKIFLQAFSGLVNGVFDDQRKTTTLSQIQPKLIGKLHEIFKIKDGEQGKEFNKYLVLIEKLKDVSVEDLSYATELSRYIDGYIIKNKDKEPIETIKIDEILG